MRIHTITEDQPYYQPAYLSNGFIGLRVPVIPMPGGTTLVNGFVGLSPEKSTEEYAPAPYPLAADISVAGVKLSARPDMAAFEEQSYDFSCGELISRFRFTANGITARVQVITFCSRTQPTLALQEISVEVDQPCTMVLQGGVDPRGIDGTFKARFSPDKGADSILLWESRGGLSTIGCAYKTEYIGEDLQRHRRNAFGHEQDRMLTEYTVEAKPGRKYVLRQHASMVPSLLHHEPHWQASRHAGFGSWLGFDKIREENKKAWAELWKSRPILIGAGEKWQDIADAAYFYLHSSIHQSSPCSIAPFGLSQRSAYSGHIFWDTETFMYPPVLLSAPDAARAMLDYRSDRITEARDNARLNGYRGIQFPWQTANTGSEVTPYYAGGSGGLAEQHISLDIAFAFAQYSHASGDDIFIRQQAWPVLSGVSEWISSRVTETERGFEIRHVTGPDESLDNVHNNSYTNMAAIVVLREAIAMAERLGFTPPERWRDIERRMFLPIDPKTNVMLKNDSYVYSGGMCGPETMAGFFPLTYRTTPEVESATSKFHMEMAHTYLGFPMFSGLYGVWAARAGERKLALEFFESGMTSHIVHPFTQFCEYSKAMAEMSFGGEIPASVFPTNPAGFLMSCMMGLPGLQLDSGDPREWGKFPVIMPEGWDGIEVERIWIRGKAAHLKAMHGDERATIEF